MISHYSKKRSNHLLPVYQVKKALRNRQFILSNKVRPISSFLIYLDNVQIIRAKRYALTVCRCEFTIHCEQLNALLLSCNIAVENTM